MTLIFIFPLARKTGKKWRKIEENEGEGERGIKRLRKAKLHVDPLAHE
jgi:hypothetical protein